MSKNIKNYTKIPNDFLDNLAQIRIPGQARQVFDVIIRQTLGWSKIWDGISLSQLTEKAGMKKPHVCKALNKLVGMRLILRRGSAISKFSKNGNDILTEYSVSTNYASWRPLPKKKIAMARSAKLIPIKKQETDLQNAIDHEAAKPAATIPPQKRVGLNDIEQPEHAPLGSDTMREFYSLAKQISAKNNGKTFNASMWVEEHLKKKSHPGAMLKSLNSLNEHWQTTKKPWSYIERIMEIENGNFHEQDAIRESEEIAGDFKNLAGILKAAGLVPPGSRGP